MSHKSNLIGWLCAKFAVIPQTAGRETANHRNLAEISLDLECRSEFRIEPFDMVDPFVSSNGLLTHKLKVKLKLFKAKKKVYFRNS